MMAIAMQNKIIYRDIRKKGKKKKEGDKLGGKAMVSKDTIALGVGLLCVGIGVLFGLSWESVLDSQVTKAFILSENSKTYQAWVRSRVPFHIRFFFWNWTNPSNMRGEDYIPILEEKGPYTFLETTQKTDIVWNQNGTVSYKQKKFWKFLPELSNGTLDDQITTLNVVAISAVYITRNNNPMMRLGLNTALVSSETFYITKPVREHLFEGYKSPMLDVARHLPLFSGVSVPFDRFGWFYKRNASSDWDGVFNMETGSNGMENFGKIRSWNFKKHTGYFADECGEIRGSAGQFHPPKRTREDVIELFTPDLCRYMQFKYTQDVTRHGLTGYRYDAPANMFDNGAVNKNNSCFCGRECAPPGALNVSACRLGAPAFVSFPHFYGADPSYREAVVGMNPDPAKHSVHLTLEPTFGIPLDVEARFQINILVQPYKWISMYDGVKPTYFPMLWFEQVVHIPEETTRVLRNLLWLPLIGTIAAIVLVSVGLIMIAAVTWYRYNRSSKQAMVVINPGEESALKEGNLANGKPVEVDSGETPEAERWDTKL